jgi:hypothetical protein
MGQNDPFNLKRFDLEECIFVLEDCDQAKVFV